VNRERVPLFSSDQICNALARAGFEQGRKSRGGSHQKWTKKTAERTFVVIVVLGRREVPRGTLRSIIDQAGMTVEEFLTFLR
jgi:predicted RNA binding protein YcfA (HicA-like mRNA interferase family)